MQQPSTSARGDEMPSQPIGTRKGRITYKILPRAGTSYVVRARRPKKKS
jgi:hypothetical protein